MTREELIAGLEELIVEGKAEIERRQAEREADPARQHDYLMAERVVEKRNSEELIYKTVTRPAESAAAFTPEQMEVLKHVVASIQDDVERKFCALAADIIRLDGSVSGTDAPVYLPKGFLGPRR